MIPILFKQKESRRGCNGYKGITLPSVTGKVYARLLLARLLVIAEDVYSELQCDFRAGRTTVRIIFCVRQGDLACTKQTKKQTRILEIIKLSFYCIRRHLSEAP